MHLLLQVLLHSPHSAVCYENFSLVSLFLSFSFSFSFFFLLLIMQFGCLVCSYEVATTVCSRAPCNKLLI